MNWLKYAGPVLQILVAAIRFFVGRTSKRIGQLEAENAQAARDIEHVRKAVAARRAVRDDPERVRDDPRNRDAG